MAEHWAEPLYPGGPTPDQSECDVGHHSACSGYTEDESDPETCMCPCHDPEPEPTERTAP